MAIGRTGAAFVRQGLEEYMKRLSHYAPARFVELQEGKKGKSMPEAEQKIREGKLILDAVSPSDMVVLLDERGRQFSSTAFATWMDKKMASGRKRLVMVIGGPYGFSQTVYDRADEMVSLSCMTFNHDMVRMFLAEQLYRGFTILRGEPYHHA